MANDPVGFSSTIPTLVFKPSQLYTVSTSVSTGHPGDAKLKDRSRKFDWKSINKPFAARDMDDVGVAHARASDLANESQGCDMISAPAAEEVWRIMRGPGPVPSAFQARIGPYKGVWMVASSPQHGTINPDEDIWIRVNPTQRKFKRCNEDMADFYFDALRLSFDVVTHSRPLKSSPLYHEFIPILRDRGVPDEALTQIALESLEAERLSAEEALDHSVKTLRWVQSRSALLATNEGGSEWCGEREKTSSMMIQSLVHVCWRL